MSRRKAVWGSRLLALALITSTVFTTSCGDTVRQGTGNSFLILNGIEAASGAEPDRPERDPALGRGDGRRRRADDLQRRRPGAVHPGLKDPGTTTAPNAPTQFDFITLDRYRVRFIRTDGRNTPGVDVPYGFDGAMTITVSGGEPSAGFKIVRHRRSRKRRCRRSRSAA